MTIFNVLTLFGGLALFLYGMNVMGDGLKKSAGSRLETILSSLTSNRFKGFLLGLVVTAVIQSSSATTVMVVGFVNSGIMTLVQGSGVIIGANLGTTITSWILSLSGISGDNPIVEFFKPTTFAPVLAVIGIIFYMFLKDEKRKDTGMILLGFAVLMFGMETMSSAVAPLANVPEFTNILLKFSNPFLGLMAGLILTVIIQSSSASIGILQALTLTGAVPFSVCVPVIMGQNLGTCITAIISSIGAKTNAKRAALIHLYYNIIGVGLFMVIFYALNAFIHFPFLETYADPAGIALVHSLFNIAEAIVLFPMGNILVKLATATVKDKPGEGEGNRPKALDLLDSRFIDSPAIAVQQCQRVENDMASRTQECLLTALSLIETYDREKVKNVLRMEDEIDMFEDQLGTYIVRFSSKPLTIRDNKKVSVMLHTIGNLERMSDHARNIAESVEKMNEKQLTFSEKGREELRVYCAALTENIDLTMKALKDEDIETARMVEPLEEVIDNLNERAKRHHVKRLQKGKCTMELGVMLEDLMTDLERISDHCSNIAVTIIEIADDTYDTHEYLDTLKESQTPEFQRLYAQFDQKYHI